MNKNLSTLQQNTQATLSKAKNLMGVTNKILANSSKSLKITREETETVKKYNISDDPNRVIKFSDNIHAWIDRDTGLMWEVKNKDNINHEYVWSKTDIAEAWEQKFLTDNVKDAFSYAEKLNAQKYAGFDDWRVPSIEELETMLTVEKNNDFYIKQPLLDNTKSYGDYFSSTAFEEGGKIIFSVNYNFGHQNGIIRTGSNHVRCVRDREKLVLNIDEYDLPF